MGLARLRNSSMEKRFYTLVFAHGASGRVRKLPLPGYAVHLILLAALVGAGVLVAGVASYLHLLLTVHDYQQVRTEREQLRQQNQSLQAAVATTQQRLTSLESLAGEVAASFNLLRLRQTSFGTLETTGVRQAPAAQYRDSLARFRYLRRHAGAVKLYASGVRPLPGRDLTQLAYTPSLWPVRGRLSSGFGQRTDPFNGEGAWHAGVDIGSTRHGAPVRAAADGFVVIAGQQAGYGRTVVVDHGGGITTLYAHLSNFRAHLGQAVQRGDVIGYVGRTGRATAPSLHYEVRLNNHPLNPREFLRPSGIQVASLRSLAAGGGD